MASHPDPTDIEEMAGRIHDLLRRAPGSSPSHRALHAKGVVAEGTFTASGELAGLTGAPHLAHGATPALVRFSHPAGDPHVSDAVPSGRGMAVKLRAPAGTHDLVSVSSPAFVVRDGASFVELLLARAPDPATGAPDPARMGAFLEAHPEALPAIEYALGAPVPASYATLAYNGLHTFLLRAGGGDQPFRYTFAPLDGVRTIPPAEAGDVAADHLHAELAGRLAEGPVRFDLLVHLGEPDDPTGDPTAIWPERPVATAGRLEVTALVGDAEPVIFDPTNVPPGVGLPPDDEILALRRAVYGLSYGRRTS